MAVSAIVFDFDGVLANTELLHLRAIQDALTAHGRELDERAYFERFLGYGDRDVFVELAREGAWTLDESLLQSLMTLKSERYRHHLAAGNALYATASRCVQTLAARYPLAIASGSLHGEIEHILSTADLRSPFRVIVGADDVSEGKPAPEPYLKAAAALGVTPGEAVAIEDSKWGLESARTAGMRTIAVTTTYPASALTMADLVVESLDEITIDAVESLGRTISS